MNFWASKFLGLKADEQKKSNKLGRLVEHNEIRYISRTGFGHTSNILELRIFVMLIMGFTI